MTELFWLRVNRTAGGEKRLNVNFSRAKHHMVVVSSIEHHQITNDHNVGANALKQYLRYAAAASASVLLRATTQRRRAIARLLLIHGADPNVPNHRGVLPVLASSAINLASSVPMTSLLPLTATPRLFGPQQ